jgi:hypothetical protein
MGMQICSVGRNLYNFTATPKNQQLNNSGGREMKRYLCLVLAVTLFSVLVACAPGSSIQVNTSDSSIQLSSPGPNPLVNQPDGLGRVGGAFAGLWHGMISPITLVLSFFNPDIQMYEVHNAGSEYNFGFLLGIAFIFALINLFLRLRRTA